MADLPISEDNGMFPTTINDPAAVLNSANVKGASTPPVATDNALVVTMSPNTPTIKVNQASSNTSTVVQITSNGANQTILAANPARKHAVLFFSTGIWSVKYGAGASSTSFTYQAALNTAIEVFVWQGQIDAICTTSGKLVNVTEEI